MIFYIGVQKVSKIGTKWRLSVENDGYVYRLWFDLSSEDFRFSKAFLFKTKQKAGRPHAVKDLLDGWANSDANR